MVASTMKSQINCELCDRLLILSRIYYFKLFIIELLDKNIMSRNEVGVSTALLPLLKMKTKK